MTTIAFDGRSIAVDSRASSGNYKCAAIKAKRLRNGAVLAFCGSLSGGQQLMAWYEDGADEDEFPARAQRDPDAYAELVVYRNGQVWHYEKTAHPSLVHEAFSAWGTGMDYALGAMSMGADAARAVRIAAKFDPLTGGRIRVFKCDPTEAA